MNDEQIQQIFTQPPIPPIDNTAKAKALSAAMEEFRALAHSAAPAAIPVEYAPKSFFQRLRQGFFNSLRPTDNIPNSRSNTMNFKHKRLVWSSLATCGFLAIGVVLFNQQTLQPGLIKDERAVAAQEKVKLQVTGKIDSVGLSADMSVAESEAVSERIAADPATENLLAKRELSFAPGGPENLTADAAKPMSSEPAAAIIENKVAARAAAKTDAVMAMTTPAGDMAAVLPPTEYRDRFENFNENSVVAVTSTPVSTFSIDVDTAAYSFVRRQLNNGVLPAKDAVRIEEMVNYFPYHYPLPETKKIPFKPSVTVLDSPWKAGNKLLHIGIKGYQIPASEIPRSNLVFLLDVSGSMNEPSKLPLVQQSMSLLLDNLKPEDTIAIVVYAGAAGTVLAPTPVKDKTKILAAIKSLQAGGATAGAEGIALAYQLAEANFNPKGVNRIILATDGDFNVGPTGDKDLKDFVERKREKGIYLSVLGFGQGNYQDAMMQTLAQNGNGVAAYIDTLSEAQKVLVYEATSTLFPIAGDVKIQLEFNPATVAEYRLLGYETRALKREDFNNDKVDAGEIGAGHSVTAIYEITPVNSRNALIEPNRYNTENTVKKDKGTNEYGFLRIRYKLPGEGKSQLIEEPIKMNKPANSLLKTEAEFATAVAGFAQILRGSKFIGDYTYDNVIELAQKTKGNDEFGYRNEFIQLVRKAKLAKAL